MSSWETVRISPSAKQIADHQDSARECLKCEFGHHGSKVRHASENREENALKQTHSNMASSISFDLPLPYTDGRPWDQPKGKGKADTSLHSQSEHFAKIDDVGQVRSKQHEHTQANAHSNAHSEQIYSCNIHKDIAIQAINKASHHIGEVRKGTASKRDSKIAKHQLTNRTCVFNICIFIDPTPYSKYFQQHSEFQ